MKIYLLEISWVRNSERIFVNIPFQTESKVPFIRHEFYNHFNQDQLNFLDNFKILNDYKTLPGFALKIHEETLLTF